MRKTLFVMFSVVLMVFAFVACEGEPTTIPEEQIEANNLAESYISSVKYLSVLNEAFAVEDETISVTSSSAGSVVVTFNNYTGDAVAKTGDIEGIVSGELTYTFSEASTSARTLSDMNYAIETTQPLVFNLKDGSKAEDTIDFEINGSCRIDLIVTGNAITGISAGSSIGAINEATITVGKGDTAITVDIDDIEVDIEDSIKDDTPVERPEIADEKALRTAASTGSGTYYLTADIPLTAQLDITAAITIDGDGHTISKDTAGVSDAAVETDSIIQISADGATLRNLTVEGSSALTDEWDSGEYGIKIYDADGVTLHNVTVTAVNAGIQVNGSKVTLTGTTTVTGNVFGGIEVCNGTAEDLSISTLTINGTVVSTDETVPAVWIDGNDVGHTVEVGTSGLSSFTSVTSPNQTWYITDAQTEFPVNQKGKTAINEAADFNDLKTGKYILTDDIELATPITISADNVSIYGAGHTITVPVADVSANSAPIVVTGSGVDISYATIEASGSTASSVFIIQLGSGKGATAEEGSTPSDITLSNVAIKNSNITAGINIHTANDVTLEDISSDASKKAPINISSADVILTGAFELKFVDDYGWAWAVQVNGHDGSPEHQASTVDFSDSTGIDILWQECVGSFPVDNDAKGKGQSQITAPRGYVATPVPDENSTGWAWMVPPVTNL